MKKKKLILGGFIVVLSTLFINVIISRNSDKNDLTFNNIEALAEKEAPETTQKVQCVESGYICYGSDANGLMGTHPGLVPNFDK